MTMVICVATVLEGCPDRVRWPIEYSRNTPLPQNFIQITKYHIAGKFGEIGKLSMIFQTKTIQISTYN